MKLTQTSLSKIKLPAGKTEHIEWDTDLAGFGLRLREGGSRNWIVQYKIGAKHRRVTIGSAALLSPEQARKGWTDAAGKKFDGAEQLLAKAKTGHDPAHDKAIARSTAGDVFEAKARAFLERQKPKLRRSSFEATERYLMVRCKPLHGLPLGKINRATVSACLSGVADEYGPVSADRCRAALSKFFGWCMANGWEGSNPVIGTEKFGDEESRDRVLTDAELAAVWNAAPVSDYGRIVKLLILTGCRREEIGSLRWSEIESLEAPGKALIALPGERTKNHRPHDVPLSVDSVAVLKGGSQRAGRDLVFGEGEGGFSGWSKAKAALDGKLGKTVKPWTLHDLRRTAATRMGDSGVQPHIVEAVINHVSGHKAGVAGIYNRAAYAAEKRDALNMLAMYVRAAVATAAGGNVTSLRRG
jgi:integrase